MGKAVRGLPEATPVDGAAAADPAAPAAPEEGIGSFLSRQRRVRGIALDELARRTRIPRRSLERLEEGAFDGRPDGFARGFVRTVARDLGLDPDDAVARMLAEPEAPGGLPSIDVGRALLVLGGLLGMLGLVMAVWFGAGWLGDRPAVESAPPLSVRRDAVRALAHQAGLLPEAGSPSGLAIDPAPLAGPDPLPTDGSAGEEP